MQGNSVPSGHQASKEYLKASSHVVWRTEAFMAGFFSGQPSCMACANKAELPNTDVRSLFH